MLDNSSFVPDISFGMRLTRYAPARMLCTCTADMAVRLLRMLPASLTPDPWLIRGNAAKSRAVKVPDFLSACLGWMSISYCQKMGMEVLTGWAWLQVLQMTTLKDYGREQRENKVEVHPSHHPSCCREFLLFVRGTCLEEQSRWAANQSAGLSFCVASVGHAAASAEVGFFS